MAKGENFGKKYVKILSPTYGSHSMETKRLCYAEFLVSTRVNTQRLDAAP